MPADGMRRGDAWEIPGRESPGAGAELVGAKTRASRLSFAVTTLPPPLAPSLAAHASFPCEHVVYGLQARSTVVQGKLGVA
jgi:hypothetical protein